MKAYARCNFDGLPLIVETFATWLGMDDDDRRDAVRLDPAWRRFAAGECLDAKETS